MVWADDDYISVQHIILLRLKYSGILMESGGNSKRSNSARAGFTDRFFGCIFLLPYFAGLKLL